MQKAKIPKVLVVNDDQASLLALSSLISTWGGSAGYEVVAVDSGLAALREVLRQDFAVIYLDVNMPGMDGYETAEAIRRRSASTPIIFITAYQADEIDRAKAYQYGASDFLFTPVIPQLLRAKTLVFVTLAAKNAEAEHQAAQLQRKEAQLTATNERLQQEIRERELVERTSEAKDDFLAMLGHELRNPLSAISSAAAIIGLPSAGPETHQRAQTIIKRQARHLSGMVEDLLELSRATSGKLELDMHRLDMAQLVAGCLEKLEAIGAAQGHTVTAQIGPAAIMGDAKRVVDMVNYLLANAVKYTPAPGTIHVCLDTQEDQVVLSVRDSGVGIPPNLLPHLFNIFVQGATTIDRSKGGLGIGLAMVHRLSMLHGGTATAHSDGIGCGSTFVLRLPAAQATPPQALQQLAQPQVAGQAGSD